MNKKIVRISLALLFVSLLVTAPRAQQTATQSKEDRVALYQALLDLTNPWTVMCIAAHPDDEDGTSLIVMRRKYGAHTVSLFTTFGEGGQNAIGPELYEELGAIRVRETMAASEIQGSEPYFLGMKDFGFSKSADEAFKVWGHDEALRRMVLQIRKLRPDVIITNHSATSNDHGHHQATARLELEAFDAAADPKRFPEQLKGGVTVWQVQRLFVRMRGNAQAQAATTPAVTIDPNERDPIRETVYAEEALRALQKHATQGPWPKTYAEFAARFRAFTGQSAAPGQLPPIRYALVREAKGAEPITKDSHNFLDGLRLPEEIAKQLAPPTIDGKPLTSLVDDPSRLFTPLVGWTNEQFSRPPDHLLKSLKTKLDRALSLASQITLNATTASTVTPGSSVRFDLSITNLGTHKAQLFDCDSRIVSQTTPIIDVPPWVQQLGPGVTLKRSSQVRLASGTGINIPLAKHLYDPSGLGLEVITSCGVRMENTFFNLQASGRLNVAPSVEISSIAPSPLVITPQTGNISKSLILQVINHENKEIPTTIETIVSSTAPSEANGSRIAETPLSLAPSERREVKITLPLKSEMVRTTVNTETSLVPTRTPPKTAEPAVYTSPPTRSLVFRTTNKSSNEASVPFVFADARVSPNLHVGYIRGFDFSLPNALNALGVESKELSIDEVKTADLQKYSSIIVDNRVYESQPELIAANQKLLDYANAGGTLIVFYHKSDEWNPDERRRRPQLAPYKLILGNERITDENAPITFLEPEHPLLNSPNKIGQEDFANWIQERGLYYPKEWDPQLHALLQSNDPGEAPLKGGLLVADYGRGHYIYSSMVWYRELRAGVPGAYRMLANMISYGQAEGKR